ncbi:MAG: CPBP family intramembrane glutamic endopeptidase [Planctomycetota bacterium]
MPALILQTAPPAEAIDPTQPDWAVWLAWGVVPMAAVLLGLLAASGVLSLRKLEQSPSRDVGLTWIDAIVGVWLWLLGSMLAGLLMASASAATEADGDAPPSLDISPADLMLGQLCAWGLPIAYWLWKSARSAGYLQTLGLLPRSLPRDVRWTLLGLPAIVLLFLATQQVSAMVSLMLGYPPEQVQHTLLETYADLRDRGQTATMVGLLVSTVVFAPVLEELFHRGFLQTALVHVFGPNKAWGRWLAIVAVSGFFAVMHLGAVPWVAMPALLLLGVCFGFLYERTGSLWPPILVHAGFNAINVAYVLALM